MSYPEEPRWATLKCLQICICTWALPDYSGKHISTTQFEKRMQVLHNIFAQLILLRKFKKAEGLAVRHSQFEATLIQLPLSI